MGRQRRPQPRLLAPKLRAIRAALDIGQAEMARRLNNVPSAPDGAMISRYERGEREPSLFVLLAYVRVVGMTVDVLIDDQITLGNFKKMIS